MDVLPAFMYERQQFRAAHTASGMGVHIFCEFIEPTRFDKYVGVEQDQVFRPRRRVGEKSCDGTVVPSGETVVAVQDNGLDSREMQ